MGLDADGDIDEATGAALQKDASPVMQTYTITENDVSGRYVEKIPEELFQAGRTGMDRLQGPEGNAWQSGSTWMRTLLAALNPSADFSKPGTEIIVAAPGQEAKGTVVKVVVEGSRGQLLAYDRERQDRGCVSCIGRLENESIAIRHAQDPRTSWKIPHTATIQTKISAKATTGSLCNFLRALIARWEWSGSISPRQPTGSHGTSNPSLVDKKGSHGCVRMTNWDVQELAKLVKRGVSVEFRP